MESRIFYVQSKNADVGDGTRENPYGSLPYAKSQIRERLSAWKGEVIVELDGGRYALNEPLTFTYADGGNAETRVIYRASAGKKVILSGGKKVEGWEDCKNGIWKARVDAKFVRNLYVNGVRATLARESEGDSFRHISGWEENHTRVRVKKELLKGAKSFEAVFYLEWAECVVRIKEVKELPNNPAEVLLEPEENESLYFKYHEFHPIQIREDMLIRFQNAKEFLDEAGEFYFDKEEQILYYYPRPNEDLQTAEVVVPTVESLIRLQGEENARVQNLAFENLILEYTDFKGITEFGFMEIQAGHYCCCYREGSNEQLFDMPKGAVQAQNAENITLDGLQIRHCGGTGINFYYGVSNSTVRGCTVMDTSAAGVVLAPFINGIIQKDNLYMPKNENITVHHITVSDCYIAECGMEFTRSPVLLNVLGYDIVMEHNEIAYGNYTGISNGWGWSLRDYVVCRNKLYGNDIHHIGMKGSDLGGIYNLNQQRGTEIVGNYIHEINKGKNGFSEGSPAEGIYLDEGSNYLLVKDNQVAYAGEIGRLIYTNVVGDCNEVVGNLGKMLGDTLDERIVEKSGIRGATVRPYEEDERGISLAVRMGSWKKSSGKYGFKFCAQEDCEVAKLGRFKLPFNIGKHKLALLDEDLNELSSTEIDFSTGVLNKNGFVYGEIPTVKLQKGKRYYLISEERAEDDFFCGGDTLQYFTEEIRFLCGVALKENIRKETNSYVGLDMVVVS